VEAVYAEVRLHLYKKSTMAGDETGSLRKTGEGVRAPPSPKGGGKKKRQGGRGQRAFLLLAYD